ncbi:ATP-grasp domain-containing protein [Streptomyces sp. CoT10]|uniref:ATP-grasp domain-containing protein n=1 Tax=Streptomyces sp. CoT10 TaxID=2875762 RepID=UPI001CD55CA7|nr:ATP-grasp domain-containing protein [Streptomyces sp. CoT10]
MDSPVVVVVDPYSSGKLLAAALRRAGFSVVAVITGSSVCDFYASGFAESDFDDCLYCASVTPDFADRVRSLNPVAVLPGVEMGVALADVLAAELTPHLANEAGLSSARQHKGAMVEALAAHRLEVIRTLCTSDPDKVAAWLEEQGLRGRDLVVKPAESAGTDGVTLVVGGIEWRRAFDKVLSSVNYLGRPNEEVIVQEYVVGTEYVVNTFSVDGRHSVTDISRYGKVSVGGRMAVYESLEYLPYDEPGHAKLIDYTQRALDALGVRFGPAHTEVMVTERGPVLIESGARLGGGGMPLSARMATGDNGIGRLVRFLECGEFEYGGYAFEKSVRIVFLMSSATGVIRNASLYQEIADLCSCDSLRVSVQDGDLVRASVNFFDSFAFGFAVLAHPDPRQVRHDYEVIRRLEKRIVIDPPPESS